MKLKFWGVRGSIPSPGKDTVEYGGNTSCAEVRSARDNIYVIDAGTGVRELGNQLLKEGKKKINIFITHAHWDHIQGFPFFVPAYVPGHKIVMYSGNRKLAEDLIRQNKKADTKKIVKTLEELLPSNKNKQEDPLKTDMEGQMDVSGDKKYFPVQLSQMGADIYFKTLQLGETLETDDIIIKHTLQNHPGGACGYKFIEQERSLSCIWDMELKGYGAGKIEENDKYLINFIKNSDVLVVDAQYTADEYLGKKCMAKKGWGHSTHDGVCKLAAIAGIKKVIVFHHDPSHTDKDLSLMEKTTQEYAKALDEDLEVLFAKEMMEINI
ncbi:MBL fold metallo-hydrolase [Candidatus Woesearchaeota archaeon]|nr:MBL fold metallo-hydrolase [Candidatus Woesearchaeota archaeon]